MKLTNPGFGLPFSIAVCPRTRLPLLYLLIENLVGVTRFGTDAARNSLFQLSSTLRANNPFDTIGVGPVAYSDASPYLTVCIGQGDTAGRGPVLG